MTKLNGTNDLMVIRTEITPRDELQTARSQYIPDGVLIRALNLFRIKDFESFARYSAYASANLPLFDSGILMDVDLNAVSGQVLSKVVGPQQYAYDAVAIVKYANISMLWAYWEHLNENEEMSRIREDSYYYKYTD